MKNRKAYFDYEMIQEFEAGICLVGTEVKSIRLGNASFSDSFCYFIDGELFLKNLHISDYKNAIKPHENKRDRKLLLTKRELIKIEKIIKEKGLTIVPLTLFFKDNLIKVKIAIARGKKDYDKRQTIKDRDNKRNLKNI
jgi:SsrA-binding protein